MDYFHRVFEIDGYYAVPISCTKFVNPKFDYTLKLDEDDNVIVVPDDFVYLDDDYEQACRHLALRIHRDEWEHLITEYQQTELGVGNKVWLVLTGTEAGAAADRVLEQRVDDMNWPPGTKSYFDEEGWKDAALEDGRGPVLSSYDNLEVAIQVEDQMLYLYRQK